MNPLGVVSITPDTSKRECVRRLLQKKVVRAVRQSCFNPSIKPLKHFVLRDLDLRMTLDAELLIFGSDASASTRFDMKFLAASAAGFPRTARHGFFWQGSHQRLWFGMRRIGS
jgi:hypothetical protein